MTQWKGKNKYKFWHSPLSLMLLFLILTLFSYRMISLIQKERETERNKISELNKIDELHSRQDNLSKDIDKLNTSEGIEESVRDKFQVVKPGEKMVVIVNDNSNINNVISPEPPVDHSFWSYIKELLGK